MHFLLQTSSVKSLKTSQKEELENEELENKILTSKVTGSAKKNTKEKIKIKNLSLFMS